MSGLCCTRQKDEGMGKSKATAVCVLKGDTSFDPLQLCFEFQSILGSHIHFFFLLPRTSLLSSHRDFDLMYFIQSPHGDVGVEENFFLSTLCYQVRYFESGELRSIKIKVVLADIDAAEQKTLDRPTVWTLCVVKILKFDSQLPVKVPILRWMIDGRR